MAYDAEVRVSTALNNAGLEKGIKEAENKVKRLSNAFEKANLSAKQQEALVQSLTRQYEEAVASAKKIGELDIVPKQLADMQKELDKSAYEAEELNNKLYDISQQLRGFEEFRLPGLETASLETFLGPEALEQFKSLQDESVQLNAQLKEVSNYSEMIAQDIEKLKLEPALNEETIKLGKNLKKAEENLTISKTKADVFADSIEKAAEEYKELSDKKLKIEFEGAGKAAEQLKEIGEEAKKSEQNSTVAMKNTANQIKEIGDVSQKSAVKSISAFKRIASVINSIGQAAMFTAKFTVNAFKRITSTVGMIAKGAVKAAQGIAKITRSILHLGRQSGRSSKGIDTLWSRIINLAAAAFIFNVLRRALSDLTKEFGNLLMANEQFSSSINNIKVNLLTAFAPIWQVLEPVIIQFIQLMERASAAIAHFMSMLFGRTVQQSREAAKALYNQAKAVETLSKSTKNASKNIQGFDQVNSNVAETAEDSADAFSVLNWDVPIVEFEWVDEFRKRLEELTEEFGNFEFALGFTIGESLTDLFDDIDWNTIQSKAQEVAKKIADFLNGAVAGLNPAMIGNTVAGIVNTAIIFADSLLTTFDFKNAGIALGVAGNSFAKKLDTEKLGKTIVDYINGIVSFADGAITTFDFENAGAKLAEAANSFVDNFKEKDFGEMIGGAINGFFELADSFAKDFEFETAGTKLADAINSLIDIADEDLIGETLADIINGAFDFLRGFIDKFEWENHATAMSNGLKSMTDKIKWEEIGTTLKDGMSGALLAIRTFLEKYPFKTLGSQISTLFNAALIDDKEKWGEVGATLSAGLNSAVDIMSGAIKKFKWREAGERLAAEINKFVENTQWDEAGRLLSDGIEGALDTMIGFVETLDPVKMADSLIVLLGNVNWDVIAQKIMTLLGDALGGLGAFLGELIRKAFEGIDKYYQKEIEEAGGNIALGILRGTANVFTNITGWVEDNIIRPFLGALIPGYSEMEEAGDSLAKGLMGGIKNLLFGTNPLFAVINVFSMIITEVKKLFKVHSPSKVMEDIGGNLATGFIDGLKALPEKVKDLFKGIINTLIDQINTFIGWVNEKLNIKFDGFSVLGQQVIPAFNIQLFTIPKIPRLKTGLEYVPEDFFGPVYLDKGERVLTAAENAEYNDLVSAISGFSGFSVSPDVVAGMAEKGSRQSVNTEMTLSDSSIARLANALLSGMATMFSSMSANNGDKREIVLEVNGREFARGSIPDFVDEFDRLGISFG